MNSKGKIIEWNRERGFGYLDHEGRRLFLHIRDFRERHKVPEVGDEVLFFVGEDKQGRPCARRAEFVDRSGQIKVVHFLILLFLALPGMAIYREFGRNAVGYAGVWMVLVSALTYQVYATDKRQAQTKGWRENETWLHWLEFLGGWPGAFFAQRRLRHKSTKGRYQTVFKLIIGFHQFLAIDALRGWPFLRALSQAMQKLG